MLQPVLICIFGSFGAALALFYFFRRVGLEFAPGPLDVHTDPAVPAGGVVLVLALAALPVLSGIVPDMNLLAACLFFFLTGFVADFRKARPGLPFPDPGPVFFILVETLIAAWYGMASGISGNLFALAGLILWCHLLINGMNMLDGLDGLAGSAGLISAVFLLVVFNLSGAAQNSGFLLLAALAAGIAGVLPVNIASGRFFFGNSGARLMGGGLALASYPLLTGSVAAGACEPVFLILILPVFEVIYNSSRRVLSGRAPWRGDLEHPYNRLASRWGSSSRAVLIYAAAAAVSGAAGILVFRNALLCR